MEAADSGIAVSESSSNNNGELEATETAWVKQEFSETVVEVKKKRGRPKKCALLINTAFERYKSNVAY